MKKFISNTFLFALFSIGFYIVTLMLWGTYGPGRLKPNLNYRIGAYGHMYTRLSEVKETSDVDILFLGSSHAYRGFDTRMYSAIGLKTFNLGSSAQSPIQTLVLLRRYLQKLNPKLVIYEVYPETFTIDGVESALDIISNDKNDLLSLEMALKLNNIRIYNTILYGSIRDLLNLNKSYNEPVVKDKDTYIKGGYVEKDLKYFKFVPFEEIEIFISQPQLESFSKIITYLEMKNIKVILVYAPIPPSNYSRYSNNMYFDSLMKSYSVYHNFNEILHLNDSLHFYDYHHMNQNGVKIFNSKLIEILKL